jgi:hypothetical protein
MIRKDPGNKDKADSFWFEISMLKRILSSPFKTDRSIQAAQIPLRPVMAVYHHVRRIYDSKGHQGKWIPEEDALLER